MFQHLSNFPFFQPPVFDLAKSRALREARKQKDGAKVQSLVTEAVRAGCSVKNMQTALQQNGYSSEEIAGIIESAYP